MLIICVSKTYFLLDLRPFAGTFTLHHYYFLLVLVHLLAFLVVLD